jgi:hypothetical protein
MAMQKVVDMFGGGDYGYDDWYRKTRVWNAI